MVKWSWRGYMLRWAAKRHYSVGLPLLQLLTMKVLSVFTYHWTVKLYTGMSSVYFLLLSILVLLLTLLFLYPYCVALWCFYFCNFIGPLYPHLFFHPYCVALWFFFPFVILLVLLTYSFIRTLIALWCFSLLLLSYYWFFSFFSLVISSVLLPSDVNCFPMLATSYWRASWRGRQIWSSYLPISSQPC